MLSCEARLVGTQVKLPKWINKMTSLFIFTVKEEIG